MFNFNVDYLQTQEELGGGTSSSVFPYVEPDDQTEWVVKHTFSRDLESIIPPMTELILSYSCEHPMILPVKGFYFEPSIQGLDIYQKLPRMKESLRKVIDRHTMTANSMITEEVIVKCFYSLTVGLEYLHNKGIPHRNLKPTNIFFDDKNNIRLADISVGRVVNYVKTFEFSSDLGRSMYTAPELYNFNAPSMEFQKEDFERGDMWSLGIIMSESCFLDPTLANEVGLLESDKNLQAKLTELQKKYSQGLISLIESLLHLDPSKRRTASEIKKAIEELYPDLCATVRQNTNLFDSARVSIKPKSDNGDKKSDNKEEVKMDSSEILNQRTNQLKASMRKIYEGLFEFDENQTLVIKGANQNWVTDNGVKDLLNDLDFKIKEFQVNNIEHLEFNLVGCSNITDNAIYHISSSIGHFLPKLQYLSLTFANCNRITDQGLELFKLLVPKQIDPAAPSLANLQHLYLSFRWCKEISNKGVKELATHIGNQFKQLKTLSLDFINCTELSGEALKDLALCIRINFRRIQELRLKFASPKIDDSAIGQIHNLFEASLPSLQNLNLTFLSCQSVSAKAVEKLCEVIQKKGPRLEYLALDFVGCEKVKKMSSKTRDAIDKSLSYIPAFSLKF